MRISVAPGTYVIATSGGVDSMVLLDILKRQSNLKLIVAHFDHGMRDDSHLDRKLVQQFANKHRLVFVHDKGNLGKTASEAAAREARYKFLQKVKKSSGAKAIITAHHKDDMLETAILNIMRGTGRRGLTSMRSNESILRPLLDYDKEQIKDYASDNALAWREDSTNQNTVYKRNYVRNNLIPKLSLGRRAQLDIMFRDLHPVNDELDAYIANLLHDQPSSHALNRKWFMHLPHDIAREVVHGWLRHRGVKDISKSIVEKLVIAIKTSHPGKIIDINNKFQLHISSEVVAIKQRRRVLTSVKKAKIKLN